MNQRKILFEKAIGLHRFPRMVGLIHKLALTREEYKSALYEMKVLSSIPFVSIYSFNSFIPHRGILEPSSVLIDKIFLDYDIDDYSSSGSDNTPFVDIDNIIGSLEKKRKDMLNDIDKIINEYDLQVAVAFSGGKGFHLYVLLKPERFSIYPDKNYQHATDYLFSAQVFLDKKHHSDDSVKGIITGMARIPNARYISKYGIYDRYSIPLTLNEAQELPIEDIIQLSKRGKRKVKIHVDDSKLITLSEMKELLDIEIKNSRVRVMKFTGQPIFENGGNIYKDLIDKLLSHYPCVSNAVKSRNPSHTARVNFVIHLNNIIPGSVEEKYEIICTIIDGLDWLDYDPKTTQKQVMSILTKEGRYKEPRCTKLKMQNFCIGSKCPYYY